MRSDFSLKTKEDTDSCRITTGRVAVGALAYYLLRRIERRATASKKKVKNRKRDKQSIIIVYCYTIPSRYVLHCFWLVLVVVRTNLTVFLLVEVFCLSFVSLHRE